MTNVFIFRGKGQHSNAGTVELRGFAIKEEALRFIEITDRLSDTNKHWVRCEIGGYNVPMETSSDV